MRPGRFTWMVIVLSFTVTVWAPVSSLAAGRMRAEVICTPTEEPLAYRCLIKLTELETGNPIPG